MNQLIGFRLGTLEPTRGLLHAASWQAAILV